MEKENLEEEVKKFAKEYSESNPNVQKVYWFPDRENKAINLVSVEANYFTSAATETMDVFVFANQVGDKVLPLSVGTIAPQFENKPILPKSWGDWSKAVRVWESK